MHDIREEDTDMIKHVFIVVVFTCLSTTTALAAEDSNESEMRFRSLYETRDKHRVFHYYQRADKNEDGHLDMSEFGAFEVEIPDYMIK